MPRKKKYQEIVEYIDQFEIEKMISNSKNTIPVIIEFLQKKKDKFEKKGYFDIIISYEIQRDQDDYYPSSVNLSIKGTRLETDAEWDKRTSETRMRKEKREALKKETQEKEKLLYLELRDKYG